MNSFAKKLLCSATLMSVLSFPMMVSAAETDTSVNYVPDMSSGELIKPETLDPITMTPGNGGSETTGFLRLQHVPGFNFGKKAISADARYHHPVLEQYTYKGSSAGVNGIPHFIQVTDVRGTRSEWSLDVKMSPFESTDKSEQVNNFAITFESYKLSNTKLENTVLNRISSIFNGKSNTVLAADNISQKWMSVKVNNQESTMQTQTSLVLNENYSPTVVYPIKDAAAIEDNVNEAITLKIPSNTMLHKDTYTSTIEWILSDTL